MTRLDPMLVSHCGTDNGPANSREFLRKPASRGSSWIFDGANINRSSAGSDQAEGSLGRLLTVSDASPEDPHPLVQTAGAFPLTLIDGVVPQGQRLAVTTRTMPDGSGTAFTPVAGRRPFS